MSRRWMLLGVLSLVAIVTLITFRRNEFSDTFSDAVGELRSSLKEKAEGAKEPESPTPAPADRIVPVKAGVDDPISPGAPPPVQQPARDQGRFCKWHFSHYESSSHEIYWFSLVEEAQNHICQTVAEQRNALASKEIMRRIIELRSLDKSYKFLMYDSMLPTSDRDPADSYMSRMHYSRVCYDESIQDFVPATGVGVQLIEPLWGMLRDPFDIWCQGSRLVGLKTHSDISGQSKEHIMPQGYAPYYYSTSTDADPNAIGAKWRMQGIPPWHSTFAPEKHLELGTVYTKPRNIHLDLGSSYFAGWTKLAGGERNSAASGQWFYDHYHARGQKFDKFIAVEVEVLNDKIAYAQVPPDLVGIYQLINVGLTVNKSDALDTLDMIRRVVAPNDFFVFKLDIDAAPIEMPIIEALLADDPEAGGVSGLIDELMFEHHVDYAPMNHPWAVPGQKLNGTLASSYNVFRDLRRKGIRAHSWP
ncbi:protein of unknown function [Taphrina deformans PYCC 5710]|uniref:Methyltransferase FkbM domain-containing protein n=1 Tax=Taphrina deformans (strain PYCC 5710 / ATCC 11124 / CBS 356.35 / IMI 108563 / JCM 9778 / NBRC 8474) TaxID=1097556 RepID=R4XAW4_TAPDE|nr:protein of unknown function [Taphrina deformans PYCC 5710]|eukprot:CCG81463.1 protein of unknown function [Taphrina deformans PYCC 5710]